MVLPGHPVDGPLSAKLTQLLPPPPPLLVWRRGLEEIYIGRMGREEYEHRLVNLVNQMPGMIEKTPQGDDLFTP